MTPPLSPVSLSSTASSTPYSDSSAFSTPEGSQSPLHIMFLGSSIGNFSREEGALFLRSLPLRPGSGDTLLIGLDHDNEKSVIEDAYNDPKGHTRRFILNGLRHAGRALGNENLVDENDWDYVNVYNVVCLFCVYCISSYILIWSFIPKPERESDVWHIQVINYNVTERLFRAYFRPSWGIPQVQILADAPWAEGRGRVHFLEKWIGEDRAVSEGLLSYCIPIVSNFSHRIVVFRGRHVQHVREG